MSITTLVTRRRVLGIKLEATQGTAESLSGTDATIPTYGGVPYIKLNVPMNRRKAPGSASDLTGIPGPFSGTATFTTHVANSGSGTAPAWASTNLAACGFAALTAGTYSPVTGSSSASCVTIGEYTAGRRKQLAGCAGNFVIKGTAGNPLTIDWTFTGKRVDPDSTAILTPTLVTVLPPRFAAATITTGGTAYYVSEFELDYGNKVALVEDATDATGYRWALVTDREPKLTIKQMAVAYSTHDFQADHKAGTEVAFSCAVGSGGNGIVTLAASKCQLTEPPADEDKNGYLSDNLVFQLNRNATDDSEFSIAFS